MKILVISQYYYPEPFRISDICESLVEMGHEVLVVTGIPNYPMGNVYPGYREKANKKETINGVEIYRCNIIPRKKGGICRMLNYFSYAVASTRFVNKLKDNYDIVFVYQLSPVLLATAAIWYKRKKKKKTILYCLDLWPESLVVGGVKKDSLLYKMFYFISKFIYRHVDKILVTSNSFRDYFKREFGINDVEYLPQFAEENLSEFKYTQKDTIDVMFTGNIGKAQKVDTLIYAANETKHLDKLIWHIVGDGIEIDNIKRLVKKLNVTNVIFHGRKTMEEMPRYYAMADAMLVTMQKESSVSLTLPGKIQSYMSTGKPILGAINGEAETVIKDSKCGWCVPAEDYKAFAQIVEKFYYFDNKEELGENAKEYYIKNFGKQMFMNKLEKIMKET